MVDAGQGRGDLSLDEECRLLAADLIRLKRMESFAKAFFTRARSTLAETTRTSGSLTMVKYSQCHVAFQISQGFLIKTYDEQPPHASFEEAIEGETSRNVSSVYLVEPRRASSAVLKFSGTLGMYNRMDKRTATIMAFSHFVLESSGCQYMFADIQGTFQ